MKELQLMMITISGCDAFHKMKSYWKIYSDHDTARDGRERDESNDGYERRKKFNRRTKYISQQYGVDGFSEMYDVREACKTCCYSIEI